MGGLVARAYLARHGAGRVAKLVTMGSPHHGTSLARLGPCLAGRPAAWDWDAFTDAQAAYAQLGFAPPVAPPADGS
jgi:pimeloyl-ACP methyl ester carboxylesterase